MIVGIHPVTRNEANASAFHRINRGLRNRGFTTGTTIGQRVAGQVDVPLFGEVRFNHRAGTIPTRHHQFMVFDFRQQTERV